ncbi:hypothetical protein QTO34_020000 [Cnephaeus nilssonii]|uniref:Uncharacterized protein n=1 Tax=Cnephaeus nilssonii TaxID=3371016 RepID=A0AA40HXM6_CNENI|nr:hypothetical protein QTO34_020000 [Eptesicus nilssonii]
MLTALTLSEQASPPGKMGIHGRIKEENVDNVLGTDVLKPSQGQWGKTQDAMAAALGEAPDPGPFGAAGPGFYHADPPLSDFPENHFLDEEVKLIKKMGHHAALGFPTAMAVDSSTYADQARRAAEELVNIYYEIMDKRRRH